MDEGKTEVIDVTGEITQVDGVLKTLPLKWGEHLALQKNLNKIISAVNSENGFCKTSEQ